MIFLKNKIAFFSLLGLLASNVSAAEIAFDLHAQHFSKAIEGTFEGARYELPHTFVTTNLKYEDGAYTTEQDSFSGVMNVELKTPISDWSVSVDVFYVMGTSGSDTRTIKLTSENGESVLISFKYNTVTFNGESAHNSGERNRMTVSITQDGDEITLTVNGAASDTATRATFGKLKYVDVQAIYDYDTTSTVSSTHTSQYDKINGLTIGSK